MTGSGKRGHTVQNPIKGRLELHKTLPQRTCRLFHSNHLAIDQGDRLEVGPADIPSNDGMMADLRVQGGRVLWSPWAPLEDVRFQEAL